MDTLKDVLDKNNLADRNSLAELFNELKFKNIVEVGVEKGLYTEVLCKYNPGAKVVGVDPYLAYRGYRDHVNQKKLDGFLEKTKERLSSYNCHIIKAFSMDAVKGFGDESLDAVYIDANHSFRYVAEDIYEWSKKVRKGGIVAGHDYTTVDNKQGLNACHVKYVVDAWAKAKGLEIFFTKERTPSWFYIKT